MRARHLLHEREMRCGIAALGWHAHQADDGQGMDAGFRDMSRYRRRAQATRVNQCLASPVRGATDKSDDVDRVVSGIVPSLADLNDELAPARDGFDFRYRLELKPVDQIKQCPMFGADAGELHPLVAKAAQEQCTRRIKAVEPGLSLRRLIETSEVITIGVDGGGLDDMLGLAVIGREAGTKRWLHWGKAWLHRLVLEERRKGEASTFEGFATDGDLVISDDMEIAIAELAEIVGEIEESGLLAAVGLDPMGVGAIVDALAEKEIAGADRVVGISQGWTLNGAIKTTEIKLANRTFVHCGQPLLSYALGNAKAEPKGNAITITKQAAGAGKIDPLMALFDAVALMSRNPEPKSAVIEKGYELL